MKTFKQLTKELAKHNVLVCSNQEEPDSLLVSGEDSLDYSKLPAFDYYSEFGDYEMGVKKSLDEYLRSNRFYAEFENPGMVRIYRAD